MVGRFAGGSDQAVADTLQGRRQQGSVTKGDDPVPTGFRLADTPSGRMTACNLSVRAVVAGFAVLAALALAATLPNAAFGADSTTRNELDGRCRSGSLWERGRRTGECA